MCDKIGRTPVFTVFGILVLIPTFLLTNLGHTPIAYVLSIAALFFVASNGRFVPAWAMITSTVKPESRGSFLSLNSSVQSLAGGAGSFLASLVVVRATDGQLANFEIIGYFSIAIGIVALLIGRGLRPIDEPSS